MPALTEDVQTFIVQRLAMYDTPTEIVDAVKQEFDLELPRQQVFNYDPEKAGKKPPKRWCDLHAATRKAFLEETAQLPLAHRAVRVRELVKLYEGAKKQGNRVLAADMLERIAKETGNAYTNKREHSGPGGAPIPHSVDVRFVKASPAKRTTKRAA